MTVHVNKGQHPHSLYVTGFPEQFDEWKLFHLFRSWGRIDNIVVPKAPKKGLSDANASKWSQHAYVDLVAEEDMVRVLEHVDKNSQLKDPKSEVTLTVKRCVNKQEMFLPKVSLASPERRRPEFAYTKTELLEIKKSCQNLLPPQVYEGIRHILKSH